MHDHTNIANDILYEDNHIIVVNKHSSDLVQGDKTGDVSLRDYIAGYIKNKFKKPGNVFVGVVHRLDRPVSGVVIFARTSKALQRLNDMLRERSIKKTYLAMVENMPPESQGTLVHYLKKNAKQNKSYVVFRNVQGALKAELDYKLTASSNNYHLLEIDLKTGRHHQIRAQLSAIGCIIKGDLKYGAKRSNKDASIHLHARSVSFTHPVQKTKMEITAPLPHDTIWNHFNNLYK